jgi:hypothetical protein
MIGPVPDCPDGDAAEIADMHFQTPFGLFHGCRPSSVKIDPSQNISKDSNKSIFNVITVELRETILKSIIYA